MTCWTLACGHRDCLAKIEATNVLDLGPRANAAGWQLLAQSQRCPMHHTADLTATMEPGRGGFGAIYKVTRS